MNIRVHPSFAVYLLCIAFLSSFNVCLGVILALLVHEACHYAACKIVGEQVEQLEITPFGGIMTYKKGTVPHKGIKGVFVHAAGPLGNYAFLFCVSLPAVHRLIRPDILRSLLLSNASMFVFNLLPALPLDGGHIVFCLGYYFFSIAGLVRILSLLGTAVGSAGLLLAIYGLLEYQMLNCSLLIVSIYLIVSAHKSRKTLVTENIYAVIQERLSEPLKVKRIEQYQVMGDTTLFELIPLLKEGIGVSFFFCHNGRLQELTEYVFCQSLLTMPSATVKDAWIVSTSSSEKKPKNTENTRFSS